MAKGNAIVMYLEQARIHGEPIGVTHSEVLFTKPNGYTVQPHNRVVSKADNKTMGESFLNELIYVLGAEDGEERKLPYDREVLVYTSDEINSDNYRTYINAVNTGINCPVHNFKLCQKLADSVMSADTIYSLVITACLVQRFATMQWLNCTAS